MTGTRSRAALAVLLLLIAGVAPVVSAAAVDSQGTVAPSHETETGPDWNQTAPADAAYATDDGDVTLVYEYGENEENVTGHAGIDVGEGLAHVRIGNEAPTNATGNATMWATPDRVSFNGTLSAPRPDALEALTLDAHSVTNETVAESAMDLNATVALPENKGTLGFLASASTEGTITTGPEHLESNGSVAVETGIPFLPERSHHFVLTEREGGYDLSVEESYRVRGDASRWETAEAATQTLQTQYCGVGSGPVDCSVSLDSHEFADGRLDIAYTVSFDGVDTTVSQAITMGLTMSDSNVSAEQAERLAGHVENVTLERIEGEFTFANGDGELAWNVSMAGSDDLALAYADVLELYQQAMSEEMGMPGGPEMAVGGPFAMSPGEMADRLRAQIEAQRAAGLTGTASWDAELTMNKDTADLTATFRSDSTNRSGYVDELQARDVDAAGDTRMSLQARLSDGRVIVEAESSVERDGMYDQALETYNRSLTNVADEPAKVTEVFDAIESAAFQRARMDLRLDGEQFTMEGAVAVENGSALSAAIPGPLSEVDATYTDFETRQTVVQLEGAIDGEVTESAVRNLTFVGSETNVSTSESPEDYQSMDSETVRTYLGLNDESSENDSSGGGFPTIVLVGGAAAVTAAAGGGLLLFSRLG